MAVEIPLFFRGSQNCIQILKGFDPVYKRLPPFCVIRNQDYPFAASIITFAFYNFIFTQITDIIFYSIYIYSKLCCQLALSNFAVFLLIFSQHILYKTFHNYTYITMILDGIFYYFTSYLALFFSLCQFKRP